MRKSQTSKLVILFIMTALINLMVGCESERIANNDLDSNIVSPQLEKPDNLTSDMDESSIQSHNVIDTYTVILSDGIVVEANNYYYVQDTIYVTLQYTDSSINSHNRILKIHNSFTEISLCDLNHTSKYGYKFSLINDSTAAQLVWTDSEYINIKTTRSQSEIIEYIDLNGFEYTIEFANDQEVETALQLYENYVEGIYSFSINEENDQLLLKYIDFIDFIEDNQNSFANTTDGLMAAQLMSTESFLKWLPLVDDETPNGRIAKINCDLIGSIATVAALSCFIPVLIVICIPATGISVACAVSSIISWFMDKM